MKCYEEFLKKKNENMYQVDTVNNGGNGNEMVPLRLLS
jgi:hypothetical protein